MGRLLLFILFLLPGIARAEFSKITDVTIFHNNAWVTRQGKVSLKQGSHQIVIGPLPVELQDSSIHFRFLHSTSARIHSVLIREKVEKKFQSAKIKELEKKYKDLLAEMNRMQDELALIEQHIAEVDNIRPSLEKNALKNGLKANSNHATRKKYIQMLETLQKENLTKKTNALKELDSTREEFIIVSAILDNYKKGENFSTKQLEIDYDTDKEEDVSFALNYLLPGAFWYPRYEVNYNQNKKKNYFKFYSIIKNNTGEDWKKIHLKLSTANPDFSFLPPELKEWHIGITESYPESKKSSSLSRSRKVSKSEAAKSSIANDYYVQEERTDDVKEKNRPAPTISGKFSPALVQQSTGNLLKKSLESSQSVKTEKTVNELQSNIRNQSQAFEKNQYDDAIQYGLKAKTSILVLSQKYGDLLKENKVQIDNLLQKSYFLKANYKIAKDLIPPSISSGGYDTVYSAKQNQTILSDNSLNKIMISGESLSSEYFYETSPLSLHAVFLKMVSNSESKKPYLAGPLDIFTENSYTGTSKIETTGPGFPLKMDLGTNRDITVERRENIYSEKSGIISNYITKNYSISINLKNTGANSAEITVIDRIPVSGDERITVSLLETTDKPKLDEKTGILTFLVKIGRGEKKVIRFTYSVKRPSNIKIQETRGGANY